MDPKSDTGEFDEGIVYEGIGEVRFYEERGIWRYSHANGGRDGFSSLEEAKADIEKVYPPVVDAQPSEDSDAPSET